MTIWRCSAGGLPTTTYTHLGLEQGDWMRVVGVLSLSFSLSGWASMNGELGSGNGMVRAQPSWYTSTVCVLKDAVDASKHVG